jgi:hypothetical protein
LSSTNAQIIYSLITYILDTQLRFLHPHPFAQSFRTEIKRTDSCKASRKLGTRGVGIRAGEQERTCKLTNAEARYSRICEVEVLLEAMWRPLYTIQEHKDWVIRTCKYVNGFKFLTTLGTHQPIIDTRGISIPFPSSKRHPPPKFT